jgi:hypothetical protein
MQPWRVRMPMVVDLQHSAEEQDLDPDQHQRERSDPDPLPDCRLLANSVFQGSGYGK